MVNPLKTMGDIAELNQRDYGEWLKYKRISLGLSRQKLSDIAYVSITSLSKYERNLTLPSTFTRAKIDNAFSEIEEQHHKNYEASTEKQG